MLNSDLMSFLKEGVACMVATRNEKLLARGTRAYGLYPHEDGKHITFYINELSFPDVLKNLISNQEVSLSIARPTDYRALQIKGKFLEHRKVDERDIYIIERHTQLFAENVNTAGGEKVPYLNVPCLPAVAVVMKIESIFNQTPGSYSGEAIS